MSALYVTLLFYIPLTLIYLLLISGKRDRAFLLLVVMLAWLMLGSITAFMNTWMPFSGGGDDWGYYVDANTPIESFADLFDIRKYADQYAQPGYAWFLSLINALTGQDLLAYKLSNLAFLIILSLTWYRIGCLLEGPMLGRAVMVGVILLTPLWYYVFFLLKDMLITLLQSIFIMALVHEWRASRLQFWLLAGAVTFATLPFRSAILIQNSLIAFGSLVVQMSQNKNKIRLSIKISLAIILFYGLLNFGSDYSRMASLGIVSESHVIGSDLMKQRFEMGDSDGQTNRYLFPFIYILTEVSGINLMTWDLYDSTWLRGILALPWIFLLVPLILLGFRWLLLCPTPGFSHRGILNRLRFSRAATTPWFIIIIFVIGSFFVSLVTGDTTRWRIPDMPALLTLGVAGWVFTERHLNIRAIVLWLSGFGSIILMYYFLKMI